MIHKAIMLSRNSYRSSIIYKRKNEFEFDKTCMQGEMDKSFYLTIFDINLVTWEGSENDWDLYYDGAEEDYDKGTFTTTKIGEVCGHYFNIERMQLAEYNLFEVFDMHNEDELCLAETLFDSKTNNFKNEVSNQLAFWAPQAFFYITEIKIKKKYQNQGYGTELMKNIEKMLYFGMDYNISFVALFSNPLDKDKHNNDESMKKLAKFYEKCGFRHIGKEICMIKIIDEFVNELVNED